MLGVVWAGGSLRVILHRDDGQSLVTHAFDALVVEIYVRDLNLGRQRVGFHREAMIVRSDFHVAVAEILNGLVTATMSEHQFESLTTKSATQQLMAEADSECRRA